MPTEKQTIRMPADLEAITTTVEMASDIPEDLGEATLALLQIHAANGDLAWVADMIAEMEAGTIT